MCWLLCFYALTNFIVQQDRHFLTVQNLPVLQLFFSFLFSFIFSYPSLTEVRSDFAAASESGPAVEQLTAKLSHIERRDSKVLVAYKGAAMTLEAKYAEQKEAKAEKFKSGAEWIEYAAAQAPDEVEIRFVRLVIQQNTPPFLRYKKNIEEDKALIFSRFSQIKSADLQKHIRAYITASDKFTEEEKQLINR